MPFLPHLVLVGCGHAHLFVLEALARGTLAGVRATLVSPEDEYFYSGMGPGVIAGCYFPADARFRPPRLARGAGAEWVRARAVRVDAAARRVHLDSGASIGYDLLSLDIGSRPAALHDLPGADRYATPLKPIQELFTVLPKAVAATEHATRTRPARIVVAGGGAGGVEVALCLDATLTHRFGRDRHRITLLDAGDLILPAYPDRFRSLLLDLFERRGIVVHTGVRVEQIEKGVAHAGTAAYPFDVLLWATGPSAPPLPRDSGLPTDEHGYLRIGATLQAEAHPEIFGAGDGVALRGQPWVPKAGVYAVREGPVLAANLGHAVRDTELEQYEPQRDWLSLMNTGDGEALLAYRGVSLRARAAWWLKDGIDRRFMHRFQRLER